MKKIGLLIGVLFSTSAFSADFPDEATRVRAFDWVVAEIERIDGEGLPPRKNRPENWEMTTSKLRDQVRAAKTSIDFGQVFRKLDATYPNLHAQVVLNEKFDIAAKDLRPKIGARFAPDVVGPKQKSYTYKIGTIDTELMKDFSESTRPAIGDDLIAINGKSMDQWSRENFIYCKLPLREQCEMNFFDHFRKGYLSWDWRSPLEFTLKRSGRTWTIQVPVKIPTPFELKESITSQTATSAKKDECPDADRYQGFKPVYKGLNVCAFESSQFPNVTVLAISSFRYRDLPKGSKIQSIDNEVEQFYASYWKGKAPSTKKLIIDLINNGGGDVPIHWYEVLYVKPFQEQYVQFKKFTEFEDDHIRQEIFYGDGGKEIWLTKLRARGIYEKIKVGQFLPSVPQFCVSDKESCDEGLFTPRPHGFKGEVRLLVNEWCVSTCTGFVWSMKQELGKRVKSIGVPDSGDSAYARVFLDLYVGEKYPGGFKTEVAPRKGRSAQDVPEGAVLRQQVTATRSTDSKGKIISAVPTPVDVWIPFHYREYDEPWETKVFKKALAL